MREILFRGKRIDNDEWVYGSFVMDATELRQRERQVADPILANGFIRRYDFQNPKTEMFEVERETVGQYTGLTDKNGAKIFEGDILRYYDDEIQVVEWSDEWSQIMLHTYGEHELKAGRKTVKEKFEGWNRLDDYPLEDMPILGNIHDNPELLKGGAAE